MGLWQTEINGLEKTIQSMRGLSGFAHRKEEKVDAALRYVGMVESIPAQIGSSETYKVNEDHFNWALGQLRTHHAHYDASQLQEVAERHGLHGSEVKRLYDTN